VAGRRRSRPPPLPPGTQPSTPRRSSVRAPRGANRAAVLRVLGDRPGVSVAELSAASGVAKPVLYNLLRTLEQRGEITKEQLPGDSTGYRLAPEEPTQRPSDAPDSILETS
jgi:MarR family